MRDYSQFSAKFWTGTTGKKLHGNPAAQVLAAYLMTSRHANQIGLYYLPLAYASHETGLPLDTISGALDTLSDIGFCEYDDDAETVWVRKMAHKQVSSKSDKAVAGARKELRQAPESAVKERFIAAYGPDLESLDTPSLAADRVSEVVSLKRDKDREETKTEKPARPSPAKSDPVFDHWVTVMEKDHSRTLLTSDRKKVLKRARAEGYTDEQLCAAIDGCRLSPFHMGENDRGKAYNDLPTILKSGEAIDRHIEESERISKSASHASEAMNGAVHDW